MIGRFCCRAPVGKGIENDTTRSDRLMTAPFAPSPKPALAVAAPARDRLAVFVVGEDGIVELFKWTEAPWPEPGLCTGPLPLPGVHAIGRPAAVPRSTGDVDVFVRTSGHELAWGTVDPTSGDPTSGFSGWTILGGYLAFDPQAASCSAGRLDVFARSVSGDLRHWIRDEGVWQPERRREWGCHTPAILTWGASYDLFGVTGDASMRNYAYNPAHDSWVRLEDPPGPAPPDVVAITHDDEPRVDLFGGGVHWGHWPGHWGVPHWFRDDPHERPRLPDDLLDDEVGAVVGGYALVARRLDLCPLVIEWREDPDGDWGEWRASPLDGRADHLPVAVARERGDYSIVFFDRGVLTHWFTGRDLAVWESAQWTGVEADQEGWSSGARVRPDYLACRAEDLVVLGVSSSGMSVAEDFGVLGSITLDVASTGMSGEVEVVGSVTVLVAGADARLWLTFPPQHVGEEAVPSDDPLPPGTSLRGRLSGVGQIAFRVAEGTRIPLTVEGILGSVAEGRLAFLPGTPADLGRPVGGTVIEMPWRLAFSPSDVDVILEHTDVPRASPAGNVALWSTRLRRPDGAALPAQPLGADITDPYPMGTSGAARSLIRSLSANEVRVERLELSALGGTFDASATTAGFAWEHRATLGRDQRVSTRWHGILLPFGHRVTYTEDTERRTRPDEGEGDTPEPIAALRKTSVLTVTQPVVDLPATDTYPFHRVELTRTTYGGLAEPRWQSVPRHVDLATLTAQLARIDEELTHGWAPPPDGPVVEVLAATSRDARYYVDLWIAKTQTETAIAAGGHGEDVKVAFRPEMPDGPVQFQVKASGRLGDVEFTMPLAFVADVDLPAQFGLAPFTTLGNPDVLEMARSALGSTVVNLPAVQVDLRPGALDGAGAQEVHALNFGVTTDEAGFRPRLGWPAGGDDGEDWTAMIGLPAIRHLTGDNTPVPVNYPAPGRPADVVFDLVGGREVDFAKQADRIGGLATPSFVADAISTSYGPVANAALQAAPGTGLDPAAILSKARLLGLDLGALIPEVLQPAVMTSSPVTYRWGPLVLRSGGLLVANPGADLTITVQAGPNGHVTESILTNVGLRLPVGEPLLTLNFAWLKFTQHDDDPPRLDVGPPTAQFEGALKLLSDLQRKVGLGSAVPTITSGPDHVAASYALPVEAECGMFRISNATFSARVEIPFSPPGVRVALGFASRADPFNLSVLAFGGGGYVCVVLDSGVFGADAGIKELEVALEFGASLAVNLGVARAEVHAVGGVRLVRAQTWTFTGYLRMGGSVELLGLVSVVVELRLELAYGAPPEPQAGGAAIDSNAMWGRATLVVELDLTLTSFDVELDTGVWVLAGGDAPEQAQARGLPAAGGRDAFARRHASVARGELT
jgi:hypothetical protein